MSVMSIIDAPPTPNPSAPTQEDGHCFDRSDCLIAGLYKNQIGCVIEAHIMDTNYPTYQKNTLVKAIKGQERLKKIVTRIAF